MSFKKAEAGSRFFFLTPGDNWSLGMSEGGKKLFCTCPSFPKFLDTLLLSQLGKLVATGIKWIEAKGTANLASLHGWFTLIFYKTNLVQNINSVMLWLGNPTTGDIFLKIELTRSSVNWHAVVKEKSQVWWQKFWSQELRWSLRENVQIRIIKNSVLNMSVFRNLFYI